MDFQVPRQQARYADTGRREIDLLGHRVLASLVQLKESDARALKSSHEIFVERLNGVSIQQVQGKVIDFDGDLYRAVKVMDPKASDPAMRGRYWRILCTRTAP